MAPRRPSKDSLASSHPAADSDSSAPPTPAAPKTKPAPKKVKADKVEKTKAEPKAKKEKVVKEKVAKEKKEKEKDVKEKGGKTGAGVANGGEKKEGGKEKVKAVSGEEAEKLIKEYLKIQNRPYSATEVSANLHGKVTKTVADKLLKEMANNGLIMGKGTKGDSQGSQWVFWSLQDASETLSPTELASMDTQIGDLRSSLPSLKTRFKEISARLSALKSMATSSELSAQIKDFQEEKAKKEAKLEGLRSGEVKQVTREEVEGCEREWAYWGKKRVLRKRAFEEVEGRLMEVGKTREEIWEGAGAEGEVEGL